MLLSGFANRAWRVIQYLRMDELDEAYNRRFADCVYNAV